MLYRCVQETWHAGRNGNFSTAIYYMVTSSRDYTVVSSDMDVMKLCRRDVFQTLVNINIHLIKMTACAVSVCQNVYF